MALSKDEADFCRMCFCVLDLSGRMFRDILTKKIPVNQCSQVAQAIRNLRPEQIAIVNNAAAVGDYREFDITLAYSFIRNKCPNMPAPSKGWGRKPLPTDTNIADDIERMRILRNEVYGHASAARISAADFTSHTNAFRDICNRMDGPHAIHVSNSSGVPYSQDLQSILNRCMDATIHQQYQSEIQKLHIRERQTEHDIKNIKENIERFRLDFDNKIHSMGNDQGVLKKRVDDNILRVETHKKQVSSKMKEVKEEIDSVRVKHKKLDEAVHHLRQDMEKGRNTEARLRDLTKERLERHSLYINRQELESTCASRLEDNASSLCILTGASGQGKTSLGLEIVKRYGNRGYDVFIVHSQEELTLITSFQQPSIFLIDDDSFHYTNKSNSRKFLEDYTRKFNHFPLEQDLKIILIVNDYMIADAKTLLRKCVLFHSQKNIINLNEWQMNEGEKRETFLGYQTKYKNNVLKWSRTTDDTAEGTVEISTTKTTKTPASSEFKIDIDEIVASDPHYGFPQTCKLFFTNETCFRLGVAFFTDAHTRLCEEISELLLSEEAGDKCQYFLLCAILFHQSLTIDNVQEYANLLAEIRVPVPDRMMTERALDTLLTRRWLRKHDDQHNHEFCNYSVFVAVLISVGRYFPEVLLRNADDNMIFDFVCSSGYQDFPKEVCCHIPEDSNLQLARKLLEYDETALFHRTLCDEKFIRVFLDEMYAKYRWSSVESDNDQSIMKIFLLVCETDHLVLFAKEMICRLLQNEERNREVLKEGLFLCVRAGNLEKVRLFESSSENLRREAFTEAIKSQQEEIFIYFRFSLKKIHTESFLISVQYGTPSAVEAIITGYSFSEENLLEGLLKAATLCREDVVKVFAKCINASRMHGCQEKIKEILFTGISSKNTVIFQQLITLFYDNVIYLDELLEHAVSENFAEAVSCVTTYFDVSSVSPDTIETCFIVASQNTSAEVLNVICNKLDTSSLSCFSIIDAIYMSFESSTNEHLNALLPLLLRPDVENEIEPILFKAVSSGSENHVLLLLNELSIPEDILYKGIIEAVSHVRSDNGRAIMRQFDFHQMEKLQILSQEWFIELCGTDAEAAVQEVTNLFGKTQILFDTQQDGLLLSIGNKNSNVLCFLLEEFGTPWVTNNVLQTVLIEASRTEHTSFEKISLLVDKCGEDSFRLATRMECLTESIRAGNTDTALYILNMIDDDYLDSNLTRKALTSSIKNGIIPVVQLLIKRPSFHGLSDRESQELILLAFDTQNELIIELLISTVSRDKMSVEKTEEIFLMTIDQQNESTLRLLLRFYGTQNISLDTALNALLRAIKANNSELPKLLVTELEITDRGDMLQAAFESALESRNITNILLLLDSFGTNIVSENLFQMLLDIAEKDVTITRVLVERFVIDYLPCEKFISIANLAIAEVDDVTLKVLLQKCSKTQLHKDVDGLFLSAVKSRNTGIIEILLNAVSKKSIDLKTLQDAFLIASYSEDGETLEYLIDENVFGTHLISENTLEQAFLLAVDKENVSSLQIMLLRFKRIPYGLKTKGMHAAMDSQSTGVVAEIAKSPNDEWIIDEAFSEAVKYFAEKGKKDLVKNFMRVRGTCNSAKDKIIGKVKNLFN